MLKGITDGSQACECHKCIADYSKTTLIKLGDRVLEVALSGSKMILCGICGNERCPKASNHSLVCTGSNEPGQTGSVYEE